MRNVFHAKQIFTLKYFLVLDSQIPFRFCVIIKNAIAAKL